MSDPPPSSVLGSLPTSRPERRSTKRAARTQTNAGSEQAAPTALTPSAKPQPAAPKAAAKPKTSASPIAAAKPKPTATPKPSTKPKPAAAASTAKQPGPRPKTRPETASATKLRAVQRATPRARAEPPLRPGSPRPVRPTPSIDLTEIAGTAVKAVAEIVEIGLSASARALKLAVSRLPRP